MNVLFLAGVSEDGALFCPEQGGENTAVINIGGRFYFLMSEY